MPFTFQNPSIHGVKNVTAHANVCNRDTPTAFACLHLNFIGEDGSSQELEAYFDRPHIDDALKIVKAINALTPELETEAA